jgi:hypothetical protein
MNYATHCYRELFRGDADSDDARAAAYEIATMVNAVIRSLVKK